MEETYKASPRISGCHKSAQSLLKRAGVTGGPVKISELVAVIRQDYPSIRFHNTDKLPDKVYALTVRQGDFVDIAFNNQTATHRQKFSVAHELGHLYMGHVHGSGGVDLDSPGANEIEANEFAAELIMPLAMLRKDIKAGINKPADLARKYDVSEEAMWWRVSKTGLLKLL